MARVPRDSESMLLSMLLSTFVTPQKLKRSILSRYEVMGPQVTCLEPRKVRVCVRL
jgi:hypothetical protein